ncbi:MAG: bifunctional aspartate kinase/homoserine dehydrogenase I [Buchnera aphidicola (Tetraneura sorini)]
MKTLKFGGTSLKNAKKFLTVSEIIIKNFEKEQVSVVLSAPSTITDCLTNIIKETITENRISRKIKLVKLIFKKIIEEINENLKNFINKELIELINLEFLNLKKLIQTIYLLKKCPKNVHAFVISRGEILSIAIMNRILQCKKKNSFILDPIKKIFAVGNYLNAKVNISKSKKKIKNTIIPKKNIILMPGFIAGNKNQELVTLGRNGSDYSAAILAVCLKSNMLEIWTDVNGIYTSDPREILKTKLIEQISYKEAIKLSYYGAKILHPKTISPIMQCKIPCYIKNTNQPNLKGTLISDDNLNQTKKKNTITGITHIDNISMISIKESSEETIKNIKKRTESFFYKKNIWIPILTKSSCEKKHNYFILEKKIPIFQSFLKKEFNLELKNNLNIPIQIKKKLSIVTIVGNQLQTNIFKNIFSALSTKEINIYDFALGNSKNSISIIIDQNIVVLAINLIHEKIFNKKNILEIFLIGVGGVGKAFLMLIKKQQKELKKEKIYIKIHGIANSTKFLCKSEEICLNEWEKKLNLSKKKFDFNKFIEWKKNNFFNNPVIIDCTASQNITKHYINFLSNGFHIITSNKQSNTNNYQLYKKIRKTSFINKKKFLYETNVGASLPVINNLKYLMKTGDKLIKFRGILSGSLSFIFGKLDDQLTTFSEATKKAKDLGFTEPNPKEDLSGLDIARKLVILSRECGYSTELKDVKIDSILPNNEIYRINDIKSFMLELKKTNEEFRKKIEIAKKVGRVLRLVGTINNKGECRVKIEKIKKTDPLYDIKNGENALIFYTKYYNPIPLVLRGYGAGNEITASGVFSDLLRVLS